MSTLFRWAGLLFLLGVLVLSAAAEEKKEPWQITLSEASAKRAGLLQTRIDRMTANGNDEDAVKEAAELLEIRVREQGQDHWQTRDARQQLEDLRSNAKRPEAERQQLAQALADNGKAVGLINAGRHR